MHRNILRLLSFLSVLGFCPLAEASPGISGTVIDSNSGSMLSDIQVDLFLDDGDGQFDPLSDMFTDTRSTGAGGLYIFDGLDPNSNYFVQRGAVGTSSSAVSTLISPTRAGIVIDAFAERQIAIANPNAPKVRSAKTVSPLANVIGGARDLFVELRDGYGEARLRVNPFQLSPELHYDTAPGVRGRAVITWDGADGSAGPTPSMGLNGIDLTDGGQHTGILLRLGVDRAGQGERLSVRFYKGGPDNFSEASIPFPVTDGTAGGESVFIGFDEFVGSVDASAVDAIQLMMGDFMSAIDGSVSLIGTSGPAEHNFAVAVPEPVTAIGLGIGALFVVCRRRHARPIK